MKSKVNIILIIAVTILAASAVALFISDRSKKKNLQQLTFKYQDTLQYYRLLDKASIALLNKNNQEAMDMYLQADTLMENDVRWKDLIMNYAALDKKTVNSLDSIKKHNRNLASSIDNLTAALNNMQLDSTNREQFLDTLQRSLMEASVQLNSYLQSAQNLKTELEETKKSFGKLTFLNSHGKDVNFFGKVTAGQANGFGVGIFDSRGIYEGDWKNNHRHGKGKYIWTSNGDVYEGDFLNGKREGFGIYLFASGEKYVGEWKNDLRDGKGIIYAKDGAILVEGNWANDKYIRNGIVNN